MLGPFQNLLPEIQIPQCSIHNSPGVVVNPDINDTQRPVLCIDCLTKHKKVEIQIKENQKMFQDISNENKSKIDLLNPFLQSIHELQDKLTQSLNKIITMIKDQIDSIIQNQTQFNELFVFSNSFEIGKIIQRNNIQNQYFKEFNKQITEQLKIIKKSFTIDNLIQGWQQNEQIKNIKQDNNKFQYLQVVNSIKQDDLCYAIAVQSNYSIVAAANNNKIRIFEFQNEKLKEIQQLDGHIKTIKCLNFMKKSQQLISSCNGGKIIIWKLSNNKQWQQIQVLNEYKDGINCLQINLNEDLIISGSDDKTIKFWIFDLKQWKCNQTLQMEDKVWILSLNESNNKIIAKIKNQTYIKVMEKDGIQWYESQIIELSKNIPRMCFIDDNQFALQLYLSDLLQIFNFDQKDNKFKLGQEIKVKYGESDYILFPMQYIKQKCILIAKNCQFLNILRKQQNGEFTLIQIIDYGHKSLFGCASDDGQFLFTMDDIQKQIQVRKLELI